MTGSSISSKAAVNHGAVPDQPSSPENAPARATRGLTAVRAATERLADVVRNLNDTVFPVPSLLPGWTRAHVVAHLARNADALVNLLVWARTGIEHPMYASRADRDADIEEGARRLPQVLREDLSAACARFEEAARRLADVDWRVHVAHRTGRTFPAVEIPAMRLFEIWLHLVDLQIGFRLEDIPSDHLDILFEIAVYPHAERTGGVPVTLQVDLPGAGNRTWELSVPDASPGEVTGPTPVVLGWLTGRHDGTGLTGQVPVLPPWG